MGTASGLESISAPIESMRMLERKSRQELQPDNASMEPSSRPPFILYIIRHPSSAESRDVEIFLYDHFRFKRHPDVVGSSGLIVINLAPPENINWGEAEVTAVVVLMDEFIRSDPEWREYADRIMRQTALAGSLVRCFPVALQAMEHYGLTVTQQVLPWHRWPGEMEDRKQRLACDLAHEFSCLLRYRLSANGKQKNAEAPVRDHLATRIKVFLSHSKHDPDGRALALNMRSWLEQHSYLSSFFDTHDIPPGMPFREVLLEEIGNGAVMVLHTDSYSSREWCRREVIEAKRRHVPMIVADCLRDRDQCSIPYLGNMPVIRIPSDRPERRFRALIQCLLEEVFRTYLWRCRVEQYRASNPEVLFLSRAPELLSLASLGAGLYSESGAEIVYPDLIMGADEARLFAEIAPRVRPLMLCNWLEEDHDAS